MSHGWSLFPYIWNTPRWSHAPCLCDQQSTNLRILRYFILLCIHWNLGGRSSLVSESRVAKEREFERSAASFVFSKEKTFKPKLKIIIKMGKTFRPPTELGIKRLAKWKIKSLLDIWVAGEFWKVNDWVYNYYNYAHLQLINKSHGDIFARPGKGDSANSQEVKTTINCFKFFSSKFWFLSFKIDVLCSGFKMSLWIFQTLNVYD